MSNNWRYNAVVNKSFLEKGVSIAGVPARKVSDRGNQYIRKLGNE